MELISSTAVVSILLGFGTLVLLYWLSTRNHDYWKKKGVPFHTPVPVFGSLYMKKPLHDIEQERYLKHGRIYGHFEATTPLLSVGEPDLLRQIFVKDFQSFSSRRDISTGNEIIDKMISVVTGEDWKRLRTIVSPTFSTGKIKRVLSILNDCSKSLVENFHAESKKGRFIDAKRLYGAYTMDVIASSAFSTKIDSHNNPDNPFVKTAREIFTVNFGWRFILSLISPRLMKMFKIGILAPEPLKFFSDVTWEIIRERERTGQKKNDFLQMLLDAAHEVEEKEKAIEKDSEDISTNYGKDDTNHQVFKTVTSKKLSMDELISQCVSFFIGGYETTASTLAYIVYCMALYPEIQEKIREEIDSAINAANGELNYEVLQSMKYVDNVISETLRLYPPAIRLERVADVDYKLGETGITIPKGMIVTIPSYAMHRDPEWYPDPEKFNPDRFTPEEREKRDQYVYLPFGAGPRNCVALRFALIEVKVCFVQTLCHFTIHRCQQTKVPLEYNTGQGFLQPKDIIVRVETRNNCPLRK